MVVDGVPKDLVPFLSPVLGGFAAWHAFLRPAYWKWRARVQDSLCPGILFTRERIASVCTKCRRVIEIERWFAEITEKRIRRGSFTSVRSLEKAIQEYLDHHNQNPKPFVWTADADLILGKIQRLCERISNSPKTSPAKKTSSTNL